MKRTASVISSFIMVLLLVGALTLANPVAAQDTGQKPEKVDPSLLALVSDYEAEEDDPSSGTFDTSDGLLWADEEMVIIDTAASGDPAQLLADLQELGLQNGSVYGRVVSGAMPIAAINRLSGLSSLQFATAAYAMASAGLTTSQGDGTMRSDQARASFNVDGSGTTVGAMSDSFDCLGGAASDAGSGDLPATVNVLEEIVNCEGGADEGRALLQIVHDVAPGAALLYHTGFNGMANAANAVGKLAEAGARVIVDDVIYFREPMFQDGIIAQAVDDAVNNQGVAYFSAAGNSGRSSYEGPFNPGPFYGANSIPISQNASPIFCGATGREFCGGVPHDFGSGDVFQSITVPPGGRFIVSFQWSDRFFSVSGFPGAATDMDIYLLNANASQVLDGGVFKNAFGDPVEVFGGMNIGDVPLTLNLMLVKHSGPDPSRIKYVLFDGGVTTIDEHRTNSGTIFGHANSAGARAVGAAPYSASSVIQPFSSAGPTPILFDTAGNPVAPPQVRQKPDLVGPDGVNTTFFGQPDPDQVENFEGDGFPNFFGTSASAPHVAGVAALMLQANSALTPAGVYAALQNTAIDMDDPSTGGFDAGFDFGTGFGFVDAFAAVQSVVPGITVSPTLGLVTTEAGGTATFTVALDTQPAADVVIGLSSSDTTEGTVAPLNLTFTAETWNTPQTVTVTGVDDNLVDGDVAYTIVTAPGVSEDSVYSGMDPDDVSVTNSDNDAAGVTVAPTSGLVTTEAGGTATFTVALNTQPAAEVIIGLSSSDTTEGTVAPGSLTFTPETWSTPQTVTVTGVDDPVDDGEILYTIVTLPAVSADSNYNGIDPDDVSVTNTDNDAGGVTVAPTSGLETTEAGGTATFTVGLNAQPSGDVSIDLSSSDTTEGTVAPETLTFTPENWSAPQTVTVTGVDDAVADGDVVYSVITAPAVSADLAYSGMDPSDVSVTNTDDDTAGVTVDPTSGLETSEAGGTDTFTVVLNTEPTADVSVDLSSSDTTEGTVAPEGLTFTQENWSAPQTVTVTGVGDAEADGDVAYSIITAPAVSEDPAYSGMDPSDVSVTNLDGDQGGPQLVRLLIVPEQTTAVVGRSFELDIVAEAGARSVAGIQAFVNFDPTRLQVTDADPATPGVQIQSGDTLIDAFLLNEVDNTTGQIDYAAGNMHSESGSGFPSGTFTVASIQFTALAETEDPTEVSFAMFPDDPITRNTQVSDPEGSDITGEKRSGFVEIITGIDLPNPGEWALVSAPSLLSDIPIIIPDDPDAVVSRLAFIDGEFVSHDPNNPDYVADVKKPVSAFFVRVSSPAAIAFNRAEVTSPGQTAKQLTEGWNLVGTNFPGQAENEFSSIQNTELSPGMLTLHVPDFYNSRKGTGHVSWGEDGDRDLNANPITALPDRNLSVWDGYWVSLAGPRTFSKQLLPSQEID